MVNKIITGITQAIDAEFNTSDIEYPIYTESIEQGFDEPCFSVLTLVASETQLVGNRYSFKSSWDVQYFPSIEPRADGVVRKNEECNNVSTILTAIMKQISVDYKYVRGTSIKSQITDNVLHFFVDYNFTTKYVIENNTEKMGALNLTTTLSKGGNLNG